MYDLKKKKRNKENHHGHSAEKNDTFKKSLGQLLKEASKGRHG
jgi:hypothetical protein